MKLTALRKILMEKVEFNPYNDSFDREGFLKKIFEMVPPEEIVQDELFTTLEFLLFLNDNYKDFYTHLKQNILSINLNLDKTIELMFAALNGNFFASANQVTKTPTTNGVLEIRKLYSHRVDSIDPAIGKVELTPVLEADIDSLIYVLNYLRHFEEKDFRVDSTKPAPSPVLNCRKIVLLTNYYNNIKSIYDESVWLMGYWKVTDRDKNVIQVTIPDENLLKTNRAGSLRLQENLIANLFPIYDRMEYDADYEKAMIRSVHSNYAEKRIKKIEIKDGTIVCTLAKGYGRKEVKHELKNFIALKTYYNFLENEKFESLDNLSLQDLLKLFSLLQDLAEQAIASSAGKSILSVSDVSDFPNKIAEGTLLEYFERRSTYSRRQVQAFLKLVTFSFGERIYLWDRPLVKYKGHVYLAYLPLIHPIIYNLVDVWIDKAGYNLQKRGTLLEDYLKRSLQDILYRKNFAFYIPIAKKFTSKNGGSEEIDLIIVLKDVILIAEVKCIKYPYDSRDTHNALKRLEQGVKQVKRKLNFISTKKETIPELAGKIGNRPLIPIVITNNPGFTSYVIDEIPITDYYLFESYFNTGRLSQKKMYRDGREKSVKETIYYRDETEMNENLKRFFFHPPSVVNVKQLFEIVNQRMSMGIMNYELYVTSAQISDDVSSFSGVF